MIAKKKILINEILIVCMLLLGYIFNSPALIFLVFVLSCLLLLFSDYENTIYYLPFLTSFAGIIVYQGRYFYFVLVAVFIFKSLISGNITIKIIGFYLFISVYCLLFFNMSSEIKFGSLIGLIYLFIIPLYANYSNKIDNEILLNNYIFGFLIATVVGYFVNMIPNLRDVLDFDLFWTETYVELTRFSGLAFDSNFYAFSNYIVIAYLLSKKKINIYETTLLIFFVISGLQTLSKSYLLVTSCLFVLFMIRSSNSIISFIKKLIVVMLGCIVFLLISDRLGYDVFKLTVGRFVSGGSIADQTTGRFDIWILYFDYFRYTGIKNIIFGTGFNASVESIGGRAAHNTFLEFIFYYGFAGFSLWLAYLTYCLMLFRSKAQLFKNKSNIVFACLIVGISFLSAYTYEAFWFAIVIAFLSFGKVRCENRNVYV